MYVCICEGVTDKDIRNAIEQGCTNYREVKAFLQIASQCGQCSRLIRSVVEEILEEKELDQKTKTD